MSEPMTDKRRKEIEAQLKPRWTDQEKVFMHADIVRECLEEIDQLKEENRKLREAGAPATTFLEGEKP